MDASDWVGADRGRALDFDGVNDFVQTTFNSTRMSSLELLSIAVWFKSRTVGQDGVGRLVECKEATGFSLAHNISTSSFKFVINNIEHFFSHNGSSIGLIALTWDGLTGEKRAYSNANLALFTNQTGSMTANSQALLIGNRFGGFRAYDGQIADVRIYNRALSPSEIKQLYEGGPGYGLRQERKRSRFQVQGFNAGRYRRQQLIGTGVY